MKLTGSIIAVTLPLALLAAPVPVTAQTEPPPPVESLSLEELVELYEVALAAVYRRFCHEEGITRDALTIPPRMTQPPRVRVGPGSGWVLLRSPPRTRPCPL